MKNVMVRAWELIKEAITKFGGTSKDYMSQALAAAWKEIKMKTKATENTIGWFVAIKNDRNDLLKAFRKFCKTIEQEEELNLKIISIEEEIFKKEGLRYPDQISENELLQLIGMYSTQYKIIKTHVLKTEFDYEAYLDEEENIEEE